MPLLQLWESNPAAVTSLHIEQIVATAGDGRLRDQSECSAELRNYLAQVSSDQLAAYAEHCLNTAFQKSGLVLQDIINELGRRLDYEVTNGRYQGTSTAIGLDGLWAGPEGRTIVVEVKTTDTYRISLDTIASYRKRLRDGGTIGESSSILIVVGREDTGDLEAQVRGSRHAWDIRMISVDALFKLVRLKESTESLETSAKIRSILIPMEFTKLDGLIDVMFTAAKDVEAAADIETLAPSAETDTQAEGGSTWEFTDSKDLQRKREAIISALARHFGSRLIKKSRALHWDSDHSRRAVITLSKRYTKKGQTPYWYAYHPAWDAFLAEGARGLLVLGCMDLDVAFAVPVEVIREHLAELTTSERPEGASYWHLKLVEISPGVPALQLPKTGKKLPLAEFALSL